MTIASGALIAANIRLSRRLGAGGMGEVWVADHLTLERQVAVKLIRELDDSGTSRERFEREAKAAARIQNPHVVQVFDYGRTPDETPFITMELLTGEDLAQRIARGPLNAQELAPILAQTASALASAHESGVVHRDIKPPNIFLVTTPTGEPFVKVLDFGIAMTAVTATGTTPMALSSGKEPLTATGAIVGTPGYMSPEQLLTTEEVTFRTDIWSLGVVAYEALTGEPPFEGQTFVALCMSICEARYDRDRIPDPLRPWFERALAIDPTERFSSVIEAAEAFRALVVDAGGTTAVGITSSVAPAEPPPVTGLSGRSIVGLAVAACLLGAVLVVALRNDVPTTDLAAPEKSASRAETQEIAPPHVTSAVKAPPSAPSPAPSSPPTASTPPTPSTPPAAVSRPSAPLVPSQCKVSCRDVGACGERDGACVIRSSADCRQSYQCTQFGKCAKTGSQCGAESAADCAASVRCQSLGHCGLINGICAPTADAHCQKGPGCAAAGQCSAQGGFCVPGSDADCRASARCTSNGDCFKNGMVCRPKK